MSKDSPTRDASELLYSLGDLLRIRRNLDRQLRTLEELSTNPGAGDSSPCVEKRAVTTGDGARDEQPQGPT